MYVRCCCYLFVESEALILNRVHLVCFQCFLGPLCPSQLPRQSPLGFLTSCVKYIYTVLQPSPLSISRNFHLPNLKLCAHYQHTSPALGTHRSSPASTHLTSPHTLYKWNLAMCFLLWLAYFTECHVLKVRPHCSLCQNSLPFWG